MSPQNQHHDLPRSYPQHQRSGSHSSSSQQNAPRSGFSKGRSVSIAQARAVARAGSSPLEPTPLDVARADDGSSKKRELKKVHQRRGRGELMGELAAEKEMVVMRGMGKRQWHSAWSVAAPEISTTSTAAVEKSSSTATAVAGTKTTTQTTSALTTSIAASSSSIEQAASSTSLVGAPTTIVQSSSVPATTSAFPTSPTVSPLAIGTLTDNTSSAPTTGLITASGASVSSMAFASTLTSASGTASASGTKSGTATVVASAASSSVAPAKAANSTAPWVGAVVGIFAGAVIILGLIGFFYRRWSRKNNENPFLHEKPLRSSYGGGGGGHLVPNLDGASNENLGANGDAAWRSEKPNGRSEEKRNTFHSIATGGMAGIGLKKQRAKDPQDPFADDQRMIQHGHSRDLTAAYGTGSNSHNYVSGRVSPTDYYGPGVAMNNVEIAEEYADYPAAVTAYQDSSIGMAMSPSAPSGIAGAYKTPPMKSSGSMPQLPPFSPNMFTSPASITGTHGTSPRVMQLPRPPFRDAAEELRNSYTELARAAQVDEPITPATTSLSREISATSMASTALNHPVARYQHGRPLSPLKELDTPSATPLPTGSTGHSVGNPFESVIAFRRSSVESMVLPSTSSSPARALPSVSYPGYRFDQPKSAVPSIEYPPPTPGVSLPSSPASYVLQTPKGQAGQPGGPHRVLSQLSMDGSQGSRAGYGDWQGISGVGAGGKMGHSAGPSPMGRAVYFDDPYDGI